jgi:hypothetical protein
MATGLRSSALSSHQTARRIVGDVLAPHDFRYMASRNAWVRRLAIGLDHTVTLPTDIATGHGPVSITLNLGVHCRPLFERLAKSHPRQRATRLATLTQNIGQLNGSRGWQQWIIATPGDAEAVARAAAEALVRTALPWLAQFARLPAMLQGLLAYGHAEHFHQAVGEMEQLLEAEFVQAELAEAAAFEEIAVLVQPHPPANPTADTVADQTIVLALGNPHLPLAAGGACRDDEPISRTSPTQFGRTQFD